MGERGELNLGQLVREHFGKEAVSIGFTTYDGTVTAASDWDGPAERKNVRPAHPESYEALFHNVDVPNFFLNLRKDVDLAARLRNERLERAIGVIYRPETELISHYFHARLPDQFDAILHYDHTRAVEPLERPLNGRWAKWKKHFRADCEFVVSAPKLCFFVLVVAAIPVFAQTPSEQKSELSPQARQVRGIAVPVPKEIFRSLDQFRDANWRAVKRPEVARWKSHGDQAQISTLLGVVIAEGFIAMEAEDSNEVKDLGRAVLALTRGLGVEDRALRRSRSIIEYADKKEWAYARKEWDSVFSDIQSGMIEIKVKSWPNW